MSSIESKNFENSLRSKRSHRAFLIKGLSSLKMISFKDLFKINRKTQMNIDNNNKYRIMNKQLFLQVSQTVALYLVKKGSCVCLWNYFAFRFFVTHTSLRLSDISGVYVLTCSLYLCECVCVCLFGMFLYVFQVIFIISYDLIIDYFVVDSYWNESLLFFASQPR